MPTVLPPAIAGALLLSTALIAIPSTLHAAVIIADDFESYTPFQDDLTSSSLREVWSIGGAGFYGWYAKATITSHLGNPGQSLFHSVGGDIGDNTHYRTFAEFTPSDTEWLFYSADIYDDGNNANKRISAGLRTAEAVNIIEMGMYNRPSHYAYRTVMFANSTPSWVAFDNMVDDTGNEIDNAPIRGWHRFSALVSDRQIKFTLDLNSDGFINATAVQPIRQRSEGGFDIIRLGGPSDLYSPGGGAYFDNILLETRLVPEPGTLSLLAVSLGPALLGRFRRCRLS